MGRPDSIGSRAEWSGERGHLQVNSIKRRTVLPSMVSTNGIGPCLFDAKYRRKGIIKLAEEANNNEPQLTIILSHP